MWQTIVSFFASIIAFFMSLFGMLPGNIVEHRNVSYGNQFIQRMDIYYPDSPENLNEDVGAFLLIHGGAWSAGFKELYTDLAKGIAQEGYVAVTMNYRLFQNGATYVEMLQDIDSAITALKQRAENDGLNISKLALLGDSAGGHLSLLYSYTHLNNSENTPSIPIAFCVGRVAPVDFFDPFYTGENYSLEFKSLLSHLVGKEISVDELEENRALIEKAAPLYQVTADAPPTILCYGTNDNIVPLSNGLSMKAKLEELNVPHEWFLYPNSGHDLASPRDSAVNEAYLNILRQYAEQYF